MIFMIFCATLLHELELYVRAGIPPAQVLRMASLTSAQVVGARDNYRRNIMNAAQEPRIPGPDHPITVTPNKQRVLVRAGGALVADTREALTLQEASYPPVQYIPRKDVDMNLLQRTSHTTHCPYKGDASYYSITNAGEKAVNAVWTYENPYPSVAQIKDYVAFYPSRVDGIEERPAV